MCSSDGAWVAARLTMSVRKNEVLPQPVSPKAATCCLRSSTNAGWRASMGSAINPDGPIGPLDPRRPVVGLRLAGVRHLNELDGLIARLEVAAPGHAGQKCCVRPTQHLEAGVRLFDSQANAELDVRAHLIGNA